MCEEILQPVLDDPPDTLFRQLPAANKWLKDHEWVSVIKWIADKRAEGDPGGITATSEDDDHPMPRVNLLGTLASFRPNAGFGRESKSHQECCCLIIKAFYNEGLINMRLGKDGATALLKAAACGNIEMASLLLEYGAGIPLWLLSGLFIRNLFPRWRACILRLGLRRGGCGV